MTLLEQGLRGLSTRPLRNLLRHHTHSPLGGVIVGTLSTAILQSSSLVGLFVLAFVGSGMLPLRNALGIVFGANLGTTLTGWLITAIGFKLNVNGYALTLIALGSLSYVTFRPRSRHHQSAVIFALGLLLLGLTWMKDSMSFLSTQVDPLIFQDYPLVIYFIGGMIFTALVQSSSATMVIYPQRLARRYNTAIKRRSYRYRRRPGHDQHGATRLNKKLIECKARRTQPFSI